MNASVPIIAAFIGGALTIFAPCSAMVLPAFFAYSFGSARELFARTALFCVGLCAALIPLGAAAGSAGFFLRQHINTVTVIAALIIICLGIAQIFALTLPRISVVPQSLRLRQATTLSAQQSHNLSFATSAPAGSQPSESLPFADATHIAEINLFPQTQPHKDTRLTPRSRSSSPLSVFLLGLVYGLAGVGCAGPILGAILLTAGIGGSPWKAALAMVIYACGMTLPMLLLASLWARFSPTAQQHFRPKPLKILGRTTTWTNVIAGVLFCFLGFALLIFGVHSPLGSLLNAEELARWEQATLIAVTQIPSWILWLLFGCSGLAIGLIIYIKSRTHQS